MRALASICCLVAMLLASTQGYGKSALRPLFRFAAGASLFARPGLGKDGALYVGGGDGYVHALAPDGSFRWSYTVKGRVLSAPVEEAQSGRVFVATSEARLYALENDSHLRWVFALPAPPKTELVLSPRGTLFFVGQDDHLYGVTTGGALTLRLAAPAARSAPAMLAGGRVALVLGDQLATVNGYGYRREALSAAFGSSAKLALGSESAIFACDEARARVVVASGAALDIESDCSSPPVPGDDFHAIAESSGAVRLVFADGRVESTSLGSAPLRPVWDEARRRLILATATGSVTVLEVGR